MTGNIRARGLRVGYGRLIAIPGLDIQIPAEQVTAIIGPNACGKSTLLKAIARLIKPLDGVVLLDGADIHRTPTTIIAQRLGLLPQSTGAPDGLVVEDLIARGRHPHLGWLQRWTAEDADAVEDALKATKMTALRDRRMDELSGGQRQRAWIAMVLAQQTPVMLLDEPTTYLDLAHQLEVLALLRELNRDHGRTIVLVLHDINQAIRYSDHLIAMSQGSIAVAGPPADVVTIPMLRDVFGIQARLIRDEATGLPLCIPEHVLPEAPGSDGDAD